MRYNQPETDDEALEILGKYEDVIGRTEATIKNFRHRLQEVRELSEDKYPALSEAVTSDPVYGTEVSSRGYARQAVSWNPSLHLTMDEPSSLRMVDAAVAVTPQISWVDKALDQLRFMLKEKGVQYAARGEFDNFIEQARIARTTPRQVLRGMIGQKLEREQVQSDNKNDRFDSVLDIAGYAVLLLGYELERRNG